MSLPRAKKQSRRRRSEATEGVKVQASSWNKIGKGRSFCGSDVQMNEPNKSILLQNIRAQHDFTSIIIDL
jgi:hypothetical protein